MREGNFLLWPRLYLAQNEDINDIVKFVNDNFDKSEFWYEGNEDEIYAIHFKDECDLHFIKLVFSL